MHMSYDNPEQVKQIYEKAVMERAFRTPVGYGFLWKLRNFLLENGISEEKLDPIPLQISCQPRKNSYAPVKRNREKASGQPGLMVYSVLLNILLALAVAAMKRQEPEYPELRKSNHQSLCLLGAGAYGTGKCGQGKRTGTEYKLKRKGRIRIWTD